MHKCTNTVAQFAVASMRKEKKVDDIDTWPQ